MKKAFQDYYPEQSSYCYGCGRLNPSGLQIKSYWDGEESVCTFTPRPEHIAVPGFVYGGLLASLVDCHGTGTAAAMAYRLAKRSMGSQPAFRYVTASLRVDYLKPTPLGPPLALRGRVNEVGGEPIGRKIIVSVEIQSDDVVCVKGEVIAVQMPENMILR